jgi:hypothetical protein
MQRNLVLSASSVVLLSYPMMITMSKGRDYISELQLPTGLLFISRLYMSMESHDGMKLTEENFDLSTLSSELILLFKSGVFIST